ncbi:uncharacterized protein [Panulirus ornatus]|uniref:uncharacterized protein n=1 Tax=Panulirus ornatus TaxID=150431 RepID=UPI003A8C3365
MCYAPQITDIHFTLGSDILAYTNAVLDYADGVLYMKVDRRRYMIEMTTYEEVCGQSERQEYTENPTDSRIPLTKNPTTSLNESRNKRKRNTDVEDELQEITKKTRRGTTEERQHMKTKMTLRSGKRIGLEGNMGPTVDPVVSLDPTRPTFDWFGDLMVYLRPEPVWRRLPSLHRLPFVYTQDRNTVLGQLHGHVFSVFITSGVPFTYMSYRLAEKVGLLCKIVRYETKTVKISDETRLILLAYTKEVTIVLTDSVQLRTNVWILPEEELTERDCYVGSQTLADNNIIQKFFEERSVLYVRGCRSRGKKGGKGCYLSGHLEPMLEDPPISILINSGKQKNYICKKGLESFPTRACCLDLRRIILPMDCEVRLPVSMDSAPGVLDVHFTLGSDILSSTYAVVDYANANIYMKVKGRRYRIEMKTEEEVCETCWRPKNAEAAKKRTKRKIDETEVDEEEQSCKRKRIERRMNGKRGNSNKRKRDETEVNDEQRGRRKIMKNENEMTEHQRHGHKRKRDETETSLGSDLLSSTYALVDYADANLYMKVKGRRYRTEMKTQEEVCETCWGHKNVEAAEKRTKRKIDEIGSGRRRTVM